MTIESLPTRVTLLNNTPNPGVWRWNSEQPLSCWLEITYAFHSLWLEFSRDLLRAGILGEVGMGLVRLRRGQCLIYAMHPKYACGWFAFNAADVDKFMHLIDDRAEPCRRSRVCVDEKCPEHGLVLAAVDGALAKILSESEAA